MAQAELRQQVEEKVLRSIVAGPLWTPGDKVVVAVSGGPDSLCLLHTLRALQPQHQGYLHVAHLDHRFRGEQSAAEAAEVAGLARAWGLPATVEVVDVPALMEREGLSAEEAARRARYRFLAGVAVRVEASAIALGHTADDQAETVLMHFLRGSGLEGLRGMRPAVSPAPWMVEGLALPRPLRLVRPLLGITRAETEGYCAACGLAPTHDSWNQDTRFLRVRLRREIIPLLETANPRLQQAILRLSQLAGWLEDDLQTLLDQQWPALAVEEAGAVRLSLEVWLSLPWTLRLLAVRRAVERVRGHLEGLGWEAIVAAGRLDSSPVGSEVALVEDLVARREYQALALGRRAGLSEAGRWPDLGPQPIDLAVPGRTELPGGCALVIALYPREAAGSLQQAGRYEAWVDVDACGRPLQLRHRRPGDRFQPLGMTELKKLQDFLVDEKVPQVERGRLPLVVSPRGIVWVVGYRLDGRFRVRPETRWVYHLQWLQVAGAG